MSNQFDQFAKEAESHDTPIDVKIVNIDGEPYVRQQDGKVMVFHVVGEYSKVHRAARRKIIDRTFKKARQGDGFNADDNDRVTNENAAAGVVGWTLEVDGKDVPFNQDNLLAFFAAAAWNVKKVQAMIDGHSSFFKPGSAS